MSTPAYSDPVETVTLILEAGEYTISDEEDGSVRINMQGFGAELDPGKPQLPGRTFHVELPRQARVQDVAVTASENANIDGVYRVVPAPAVVHDRAIPERLELIDAAQREWETNREAVYGTNEPYPETPIAYLGQWIGRERSYARIRFRPFQYRPRRGRLTLNRTVRVAITYTWSAAETGEAPLRRAGSIYLQPERLARPGFKLYDSTDLQGVYDFVIIVPDAATGRAMSDFKAWKERIGHSVAVVEVGHIYRSYNGVDNAERIRAFLVDKQEVWGIHYVLLAGDMDLLPTRILYPSDAGLPYAADFYYADLSTLQWDADSDRRWGEFNDDNFNWIHDVVVARLPFNTPDEIHRVCENIVRFEQDTGGWKQVELFAHGFMDLCPTDGAELAERISGDFLAPAGWTARKLYEQGGTAASIYASDLPLTQANFVAECGPQRQGLVCLTAHGDPDFMQSLTCTEPSGNCNCGTWDELGRNDFGNGASITGDFLSAAVVMNGCSTAVPVPNYDAVEAGGRSLFQMGPVQNHNGRRYLQAGAVAVVGSSAGSDYAHNWKKPADGQSQSLTYYFHEHLIKHRKSVGDAFFDAAVDQANKHGLARGLRVFYLMGDPSLVVTGINDRPGGEDTVIHEGRFSYFAAANDDNGDMYVVVAIGTAVEPARFRIYRSTDHGRSWSPWQAFEISESVAHVEALVNRYGSGEFADNRLLVFFTTYQGSLQYYRFPLSGSPPDQFSIPTPGGSPFAYFAVAKEMTGANGRQNPCWSINE
jgi:hypothetical protein